MRAKNLWGRPGGNFGKRPATPPSSGNTSASTSSMAIASAAQCTPSSPPVHVPRQWQSIMTQNSSRSNCFRAHRSLRPCALAISGRSLARLASLLPWRSAAAEQYREVFGMHDPHPYLSIVATSRNDDHGGNMRRRMQTFVNALTAQCRRHALPAELIIVEWNPPADRPRLADALRWPADSRPCAIRIIEVPEALHKRFDHADRLPLFQMIAKNVGIRHSRAPFVLATNIDILFNDELMAFLAARRLQPGCMYRIDRTDVGHDVPVDAPIDEQLAYCRSHLLRINAREGVFPLDAGGLRALLPNDITGPESGCRFDLGWYAVEQDASGRFRWATPHAVLVFPNGCTAPKRLCMEVEPGPAVGYAPFDLEIRQLPRKRGKRLRVERRQTVEVPLIGNGQSELRLELIAHASRTQPVPNEPRPLAMRAFSLTCEPAERRRTASWLGEMVDRIRLWSRRRQL